MQKTSGLAVTEAQIRKGRESVDLTYNEKLVLEGFLENRHQAVTASRLSISQPMVSMILHRAFRKIKAAI